MKLGMKTQLAFAVIAGFLSVAGVQAQSFGQQVKVEVVGVGSTQIPIAVAAFSNEEIAPQVVSEIIRADLERSGYFRLVAAPVVLNESSAVDLTDWKSKGAEALLVGSVSKLPDTRFEVKYKLYDTIKGVPLSAFSVAVLPQSIRHSAHKVADDVYEKLTGVPGVFATRIAYVARSKGANRLEIADADGENVKVALTSSEAIMSPSWSPDGTKLAYVSFESRKPVVWVQNLLTGERKIVANFRGNNSAPSWSPDGTKLAVALSRDAVSQIYTLNLDGSGLKRLSTISHALETEPVFSPDGQTIFFVSDRSGGPQIYQMPANGGEAKRLTFNGGYNVTPRISPDGKYLGFVSRRDGRYQIYALDLINGQEIRLSDGQEDQNPSFAPNGRYIMFASEGGRQANLAVTTLDGKIKQKISIQTNDVNKPTWGPFMK